MEYFFAGIGTGLTHAVIYNPYDRALYLSVENKIPFLDKANWANKFQGLHQSLFYRVINNGLYFSMQSIMSGYTNNSLYIGLAGGLTNAAVLNPLSVIKYNCWSKKNPKYTFTQSMKDLYKDGGVRIYGKGAMSTAVRDATFCCAYELGRKKNGSGIRDWMYNLGVSISSTILASPFNYVRNKKFATPSNVKCDNDIRILLDLIKNKNYNELRLGWGTFRCGLGMVTGQLLYDNLLKAISQQNKKKNASIDHDKN